MKKFAAYLAAGTLAAALWSTAACASRKDDTLVVAITAPILNVDRLYTTARQELILAQLTDDGLFDVDPDTLRYVPLVAKSYKFVDDTTLDVTLRKGVKFHDGSPLTADDVVYTYRWTSDPKSGTNQGRKIHRWLKSVERLADDKLRFKLNFPYPLVLRDMAISVPLRKRGTYASAEAAKTQNSALNGLGPYRVIEFDPGKKVVLERFAEYYKGGPKGSPSIRHIEFRTIPDLQTQQAELMTGGVQFMYGVPLDIARNIGATPAARFVSGSDMRVDFIIMDAKGYTGKDDPFVKLDVRRAMNYAINRKSIVDNLVGGSSRVIDAACNPLMFGCVQDVMRYGYDPQKAKALLAQAGYPDGFQFDFWVYREKPVAEAIMSDLAKVGIKAKMRVVTSGALAKARRSREVQAYFGSWGSGGTADAAAIASEHFAPKSNRNLSGDAEVDDAVIDAEQTMNDAKRMADYTKAFKRIAEMAYWVPLYTTSANYLVARDLSFAPPKDGLPRLYLLKWKR